MTKRNPCRVMKIEYNENGVTEVERRGYAQERKTIDGVEMVFVMEGGDSGIGLWYPSSNVTMTKGKWTNAKRANKLGYYLWKRINQDQENYRKTRPPNIRGLYFNRSDIDSYIKDYFNYGWDWDDTSKEELQEPNYWDERDVDV